MARVGVILATLWRVLLRDLRAGWSIWGNNFFVVSALLLQEAGGFVYLIVGLVILAPLSTDPLSRIPASRLASWPLSRSDKWLLRATSPWVNPVLWLIAVIAGWAIEGGATLGIVALLTSLVLAGFLLSSLPVANTRGIWRRVPHVPWALDRLVRKNLRQILSTLDFYCALVLSVSALAYQLTVEELPIEALTAVTILVVLALSSYAQSLFGLDGENGLLRYRLLPLAGWQILAAKDCAYLIAVIVVSLPLAPVAGVAAGISALAVGHHNSVRSSGHQARWRFSSGGPLFPDGFVQSIALAAAAWQTSSNALYLVPVLAVGVISLWWYGRTLDRRLSA